MKKVKVHRYISGKRPEYANYESTDEESDEHDFAENRARPAADPAVEEIDGDADDPRLRRLINIRSDSTDLQKERLERHRHIHEPEILDASSSDAEDEVDDDNMGLERLSDVRRDMQEGVAARQKIRLVAGSDSDSDELSDTEIERRRQLVRFKLLQQQKEQEELLEKEEEKSEPDEEEEEESSDEETEDSEDEDNEPRLKPLFVRKKERTTASAKEAEVAEERQLEFEEKRVAKERRRQALRLVEESVKKDLEKLKPESNEPQLNDVCTDDDENDAEVEYEAWKLRELKRVKRDRDEKEQLERERLEADRLRHMSEEERKAEARLNPKVITNKAQKGKYKFLQKYYHRGVFYLDEEDEVLKRDYSGATLEDHFDKTVLPKVMQVKNFGRCGRTKYTHLVDQDTTNFDSAWHKDSASAMKFHMERAAGMKQVFEKPSLYRKRKKSDM